MVIMMRILAKAENAQTDAPGATGRGLKPIRGKESRVRVRGATRGMRGLACPGEEVPERQTAEKKD
jgi:hypothetical protein